MKIKSILKELPGQFTEVVQEADHYEEHVHLHLKGDKDMKSWLGTFISLVVVIFLLVQFFIKLAGMVQYDGPAIIQMNEFQNDPGLLNLSQSTEFIFAIGVTSAGNNVNTSQGAIISFSATYNQNLRDINTGNVTKFKYQIHWAPCQPYNFPNSTFGGDVFSLYQLAWVLCPTYVDYSAKDGSCPTEVRSLYSNCRTPPNFRIKGTYLSVDFEFIQIKFTTCKTADAKNIDGLVCAPQSVIDSNFNSSEIKINLYYTNTLIVPVEYETPSQIYIDSIYWTVNPSKSTLADVFMDQQTVQDYDSFFYTDTYTNRSFYSIDTNILREIQVFQGTNLLEANLRRSNLNHVTTRTYTKLLDIVGSVGGMSEILFIAGGLILLKYMEYKYQMMLSNELYDFDPTDPNKRSKKDSKKSPRLEIARDSSDSPERMIGLRDIELGRLKDITSPQDTPSKNISSPDTFPGRLDRKPTIFGTVKNFFKGKRQAAAERDSVKSYFDSLEKRKKRLGYGICSYYMTLMRWICCSKNPEHQLGRRAREQISKDIDIVKMSETLKEVEKLKLLLLNRHQREVFNYIEKPVISLDSEEPVLMRKASNTIDSDRIQTPDDKALIPKEETDIMKKLNNLYASYRHLHNDGESQNLVYNRKLIQMMGQDLVNVFEKVDNYMGENIDPRRFEYIVKRILSNQPDESHMIFTDTKRIEESSIEK